MVNKKDLIIAILVTFCLTATLFMIIPTRSQVGEYDPWADIDDDGKINMYDIGYAARLFSTEGDPTKSVIVTGWPNTTDVLVWWNFSLNPSSAFLSKDYSADGFSYITVIAKAVGLTGVETIEVEIHGKLWNDTHTAAYYIEVGNFVLNSTSSTIYSKTLIPSAIFVFLVKTDASSSGSISVSFYKTLA